MPISENRSAFDNRRRFRRFSPPAAVPVLMEQSTGLMKFFGPRRPNVAESLADLSEGGALFVTTERIEVGRRVKVRIVFGTLNDSLEAEGVAVRCCRRASSARHRSLVAVRFDALEAPAARKIESIRSYLESPAYRQKETQRAVAMRSERGGSGSDVWERSALEGRARRLHA